MPSVPRRRDTRWAAPPNAVVFPEMRRPGSGQRPWCLLCRTHWTVRQGVIGYDQGTSHDAYVGQVSWGLRQASTRRARMDEDSAVVWPRCEREREGDRNMTTIWGAVIISRRHRWLRFAVIMVMGISLMTAPVARAEDDDATVVADGGNVDSSHGFAVSADGDSGAADTSGGDLNTAEISDGDPAAQDLPPSDLSGVTLEAGNGGEATADGSGGSVAQGEFAADGSFASAPITTGGNTGNDLLIADTAATSGDATVVVTGADVSVTSDVTISANGGAASASATGGDGNDARFTCEAEDCLAVLLLGDAELTNVLAASGNGGTTTADARGGAAVIGALELGGNTGGVITVGNTAAAGGATAVLIDGGTLTVTTVVELDVDGGAATAAANGGDANEASFTCATESCDTIFVIGLDGGVATAGDLNALAGNGGSATAQAIGGDATLGDLLAGGNGGTAITVGDTTGAGGSALVDIDGGAATFLSDTALSAGGGAATADASGGDENLATFTCAGFDCSPLGSDAIGGGASTVTDVQARAGNGGEATADAGGGSVAAGDVISGDNTGHVITVGDTTGGTGGGGGDATVLVDGGALTAVTELTLAADGGDAIADATGGDGNEASFDCEGTLCVPVFACVADFCGVPVEGTATISDIDLAAGNGGVAEAVATGGTVSIGNVASGSNAGNVIGIGDTSGGVGPNGGDATVIVDGGAARYITDVNLSANGGIATATGAGGDSNTATVFCDGEICTAIFAIGTEGAASITDVNVLAGNGGTAVADAIGGAVVVGDLLSGENEGNVVSVGDTTGGDHGGDALVVASGGDVLSTFIVSISVDAVSANADASGGDDNLAALTCTGDECEVLLAIGDATISGVTVSAGNGGTATAIGGTAAATATGGDRNEAILGCTGDFCTAIRAEDTLVIGPIISVGDGGTGSAIAPEGTVSIGDIVSGGNAGNEVSIGDTTGGA